jgi:hypothetical protein
LADLPADPAGDIQQACRATPIRATGGRPGRFRMLHGATAIALPDMAGVREIGF